MAREKNWTRRGFIKAAGIAGGATLLAGQLSVGEAEAATPPIDPTLDGVCDLHVHADPDVRPRSIDEMTLARKARQMGYRALMFKSHDWSTHDRAYLIRNEVPQIECFGGLALNKTHGDSVNVTAAEMTVKTTGNFCRCIWMPTYQSAWDASQHGGSAKGIPVTDGNKTVLPEVVKVMEICGKADMIFATGHSAPTESVLLAQKAKEVGLKKFVVTHANSNIWKLTHDQVKQCVDLGAYIEYSYVAVLWGPGTGLPNYTRQSSEDFTAFVKIAPERSFVTTDLGQAMMPSPIDGMRACILDMLKAGISKKDVDIVVRTNPARLMGLDV